MTSAQRLRAAQVLKLSGVDPRTFAVWLGDPERVKPKRRRQIEDAALQVSAETADAGDLP